MGSNFGSEANAAPPCPMKTALSPQSIWPTSYAACCDLDAALRLHAGSPGMPTPDALSMGFAFIRPCYGGTPCHATTRPHLFAPLQEVSEQHGHGGDAHSR